MLLYHLHDWQHAALTPFRFVAGATQATFQNPFLPTSYTRMGRAIAAGAELFERTTRKFGKPTFGLRETRIGAETVKVEEETIVSKPFCRLIHFKRDTRNKDPRVMIVAPMSGHYATLLRGTVEALLPNHDVYKIGRAHV